VATGPPPWMIMPLNSHFESGDGQAGMRPM